MGSVILDQQSEPNVSAPQFPEALANMLLLNSRAIDEIDLLREKIKSGDYVEAEVAIKKVVNTLNKLAELGKAEFPKESRHNKLTDNPAQITVNALSLQENSPTYRDATPKMKWKEESFDFDEALFSIKKAKRSLEDQVALAVAEIILFKSKKLVEDGHWQYGLDSLYATLEQFRKLNDFDGMARTFIEIGTVQELFGDYELARLSFLDAERLFKKAKREEGVAVAELQLGTLALDHYDYEQARPHLKFASNFFHQHGDQERAKLSDDFLNLADEFERELALV